jgi:hypothetical protein
MHPVPPPSPSAASLDAVSLHRRELSVPRLAAVAIDCARTTPACNAGGAKDAPVQPSRETQEGNPMSASTMLHLPGLAGGVCSAWPPLPFCVVLHCPPSMSVVTESILSQTKVSPVAITPIAFRYATYQHRWGEWLGSDVASSGSVVVRGVWARRRRRRQCSGHWGRCCTGCTGCYKYL